MRRRTQIWIKMTIPCKQLMQIVGIFDSDRKALHVEEHRKSKEDFHMLPGSTFFASAKRKVFLVLTIFLLLGVVGCASVPKESVELSYTIGQDLEALHQSHKLLVQRYFTALRREVNKAIDTAFMPAYINSFVRKGKLIEHATNNRADLVEAWARIAVETLDKERRQRLAPLNQAEQELLATVDQAFDRAVRANATVTAHLNSIREVDEVQNEVLEALNLKDLRDKINNELIKVSDKAAKISKDIDQATSELKNKVE